MGGGSFNVSGCLPEHKAFFHTLKHPIKDMKAYARRHIYSL